MVQQEFTINSRYKIVPSVNMIRDLHTQKEIKLESRLIHLLCLLAKDSGKLVEREYIIKEIWNDYPGGDEGLFQAIFHLRKTLEDTNKEIIETIPKKGYVLHADVTYPETKVSALPKQKSRKVLVSAFMIFIIVIITGYVIFRNYEGLKKAEPVAKSSVENTEIPFPDLNVDNSNIVTTIDTAGTRYKLVQVGDGRPAFYINEQLIKVEEQEQHLILINKMRETLQKRKAQQNNAN
ncbi:hypothetical protein GCM10009120_51080 [Sphingobacterium siyangense subsp. cladoniae]|uniref:winged helix-turn-helix domain-containing protein n=1 Tax=Sphingobacterium siyangense TaxID=459529 RepID=UPI0031F81FA4